MVQRASQENQPKANGVSDVTSPYLGTAPEHSMAFDVKDVADISVPNVSTAEVSVKESNGMERSAFPLAIVCCTDWIHLQAPHLRSRLTAISRET